jgi:hypothetical protein
LTVPPPKKIEAALKGSQGIGAEGYRQGCTPFPSILAWVIDLEGFGRSP